MIIGIFGNGHGCGKTTLANYILEADKRYQRRSFAAPLKKMMSSIFLPIDTQEEKLETTDIVASSAHVMSNADMRNGLLTRRGVAQYLGTELIRKHLDPDFFVKIALNCSYTALVFDDCRFLNEVRTIKALGGVTVKVERDGIKTSNHESEQLDWDADFEFSNNGDFEDVRQFAQTLMYDLREL